MRTVVVEEELLLVDPSGRPVPLGPDALEVAARRGEGEDVAEHDHAEREGTPADENTAASLVPELKAQQLEFGTAVCTDLAEIDAELRHWRARANSAQRPSAPASPRWPPHRSPSTRSSPRASGTPACDVFGPTAREMLTCGCHVHVSVADEEEGVAVLNRIRVWLPVLTPLTANSPFWQGEDTGYAIYRSQVWRRWPSAGPIDVFPDAAA